MKLYLHIADKESPAKFETGLIELTKEDATIQDLQKEISAVLPSGKQLIGIGPTYRAENFTNLLLFADSFFKDGSDVFVTVGRFFWNMHNLVETLKAPVVPEADMSKLFFEPIAKYTFYENDDENVRVTFDVADIGKHPKEKFQVRFLDKSLELKIIDLNGRNFIFAVGKLQNRIIPEQSKFWTKDHKIIINLKKFKKGDPWPSLHATKTVGGDNE